MFHVDNSHVFAKAVKRAIVIQNDLTVGLGIVDHALRQKGFKIKIYDAQKDDLSKIDLSQAEVMIILGGRAGAYEHDEKPWLRSVEELIRKCMAADLPLLGSCLGGQLIAQVLGAKVYKCDEKKEVGYYPLELTDAGSHHVISRFAANGIRVPESHGDVFELPEGVTLLASTARNPNQVFVKGNTLAFQFHPEATAAMFESWVHSRAKNASENGQLFDEVTPLAEMQNYAKAFESVSAAFFDEWIETLMLGKENNTKLTL